jgi:ElaB/YqjD/DUF883 family membrane-anchored ribosome-binding protein
MTARTVKSTVGDAADRIHNGVDAAEDKLDENIDAFSERLVLLEKQLRQTSDLLLKNAKELGGSASKQIQMHPLAAFGVAFVAGVTLARLLRR